MTEDYLSKNPYCLFPRVPRPSYFILGNYKSNDATWYNGLTEEEKKAHKAKLEKYLELPEGSLALAGPFFWESIQVKRIPAGEKDEKTPAGILVRPEFE